MDAISAVIGAREGGMPIPPGFPIPPETEIDPELEQPTPEEPTPPDDTEFENPDDIDMPGSTDDEDDDDEDKGDPKKSDESDPGKAEDKKEGDESDPGKSEEGDSKKPDDDDLVDDEEESKLDKDLTKDGAEEEEKKKMESEAFRRRVEAASCHKQIKRALDKDEKSESPSLSEEDKATLKEIDEKLSEMHKELKENPEKVKDMSASEFNELINKALDIAEKAGVAHTKIDNVKDRIAKIKDDAADVYGNELLDDEDKQNIVTDPEYQKMKAAEREKERLKRELEAARGAAFKGNMETFKADLKKAIGDQIRDMMEVEEETYAIVNRAHELDDIAVPGIRIDDIPDENKPSIDVYFDQSGSWSESEVRQGMAAIKDMLDLEKEDYLKLNIFYFSEILTTNQAAARSRGARECWDLIIQNIDAAPKTKNVIIMTDSDIAVNYNHPGQHGCIKGPGTVVPGCVWFLWKNGDRVPEASIKLRGRKGTYEYKV